MLNLWIDGPKGLDYIYSAGIIFEAEYESEWIEEPIISDMILDVDKSKVVSGNIIDNPILGMITPLQISGGVKALIMASHDSSRIYNLSSCGDNCSKWALRLAKDTDIVMRLGYIMKFEQSDEFCGKIMNTGITYANVRDFTLACVKCLQENRYEGWLYCSCKI